MQQQQMQQQQQQAQMMQQETQAQREFDMKKHDDIIAVKREEIELKRELGIMHEMGSTDRHNSNLNQLDSDANGIADYLDIRRTEAEENYRQDQTRIAEEKLAETQRTNKAREELDKQKVEIQKKQAENKTKAR
jgi:hypothetical protein